VTVPANASSITFSVTPGTVTSDTGVTVKAAFGGKEVSTTLTVQSLGGGGGGTATLKTIAASAVKVSVATVWPSTSR